MDRLHIVFYVGIKNNIYDLEKIKEEINIQSKKDLNTSYYFVPDCYSDIIKIDCINPKMVNGDDYKDILNKLSYLERSLKNVEING